MDNLVEMVSVCCGTASSRALTCAQIRNGGVRISGFRGMDVMAVNSVLAANNMRCTFLFESDTEIQLDVYPRTLGADEDEAQSAKRKLTYNEFAAECGSDVAMDSGTACNAVRRRTIKIAARKVADDVFIALTNEYNVAGIRLLGREVQVYTTIDTSSQYSLSQIMQCPGDIIKCLLNRKRVRGRRSRAMKRAGRYRIRS